ncbi:MAG: 1-acyl-sn-glycerol-3-phosphate acyltransferase [Fibromonadaceae bacterium]|nr:1-acyl-sn-glycerol-3-phosphate acyltransferase [Fibromonadaceae bacterium]
MRTIRANILGAIFYLTITVGLFTVIPPWFFYCVIFNKQNKFVLICKPFFFVVFSLFGVKIKLEGNLPEQGKTCFVLCNHQSFIDVPIILYKLFPCAFLAKKSLFKIPYFGQLLTYTNSIPIVRGNPEANANLPKQVCQRLSKNFPMMAFPEGTRSKDGRLLPFKNGIFRIIKEAGVPVLPVTLIGVYKVMPKTGIALYPGEIKIITHKIIAAEQIANMSQEELREAVRAEIQSSL